MAESDYPILLFPAPARADRTKKDGFPGGPKRPSVRRQSKRLAFQFQRLQDALENRRLALQDTALGIEPEMTLVLKTVGSVKDLYKAVQKIDGLEWLAAHDVAGILPGDGFEDARDPEKPLAGQLFLVMSDQRALTELLSLFDSLRDTPDATFRHGFAPLKKLFESLKEVRPWGVEDRLEETGLLEDWRDRVKCGQETVPFEAELWYRGNRSRRRDGAQRLRHLVRELGGEVVTECAIPSIAYHAVMGQIDITRVERLLDHPAVHGEVALFRCDDVMFFRPVGQCATPIPEAADEVPVAKLRHRRPRPGVAPVVALLDGLPLTQHALLDGGRLEVDDPDDYETGYQARERSHGTAMASLICHGDLDAGGASLGRPIYVRPIMRPRRGFAGNFVESIPERVLPVDLMHRAVVRLFEGERDEPPVAPEIRVVNLSIGDPAKPFVRDMSAWARLLDWLSWKYNVLFVVSAGNHAQEISFDEPPAGLLGVTPAALQRAVLSAVAADTRHRRLLSPAETLNGLTVGAVHDDESGPAPGHLDPLESGLPSVFSAHGPGHRRAIKPEILLPGGRQVMSKHPLPPTGKTVLRPHTLLRPPGQRVATPGTPSVLNATHYTRGTSNAAALASREACVFYELLETLRDGFDGIPPEFDAVLLKTLLVHGAEWSHAFETYKGILGSARGNQALRDHVARFLGYGRPHFERVATGTDRRVTVLGFGSLRDGEAAKFALPLPPSLSGVRVKRRLTVTLAWFSPINGRHRRYRAAHLWFGKPEPTAGERSPSSADSRASQRGTVQHEVFERSQAMPISDGDEMIVKVNCRKDAGDIDRPVRFGLAVTLEIAEPLLSSIHEEVRARIAVRVRAAAGPA